MTLFAHALEKVKDSNQMQDFAELVGRFLARSRLPRVKLLDMVFEEFEVVRGRRERQESLVMHESKEAELFSGRLIERMAEFGTRLPAATNEWGQLGFLSKFWWMFPEEVRNRWYTETLRRYPVPPGQTTHSHFLKVLRENVPWSRAIDEAMEKEVHERYLAKENSDENRRKAISLTSAIRSLEIRDRTLKAIWDTFGVPKDTLWTRFKARIHLWAVYRRALKYWDHKFLERLRTLPELQAFMEATIESYRRELPSDAMEALKALHKAHKDLSGAAYGEASAVFVEDSRHKDDFLQRWARTSSLTVGAIGNLHDNSTRRREGVAQQLMKAVLEALLQFLEPLGPEERGELAEYLAGVGVLSPPLEQKLQNRYYGTDARTRALKRRGLHFDLPKLKTFLKEMHTADKAVAFRSLFLGKNGISMSRPTEDRIFRNILFQDPDMPHYLRRVLEIYFSHGNATERSLLLARLLANQEGRPFLTGPEVLRLVVLHGGLLPAKLAQLIASHGFGLSKEYRSVMEVFKGSAQAVEIQAALQLMQERLPTEVFEAIDSLERELGSGGIKTGYLVKLKDGRRIVVKLARQDVIAKVYRELQILDLCIADILADPDLRIDSLMAFAAEVKRLTREELDFVGEKQKIAAHAQAQRNRPLVVRWFGQEVSIYVPKPLPEWSHEGIGAEEYVDAKNWDQLPESGTGWTREGLARAALQNIVNELLAYLNPAEQPGGNVILDIDPHEYNNLARWGLMGRQLVDIDFGQSVRVPPEKVKNFVGLIYHIYRRDVDAFMRAAETLVDYRSDLDRDLLRQALVQQMTHNQDPVSIVTKTLEEVELKGLTLKAEFLFLQKLFATANGLQQHVKEPEFLMNQIKRGLFLRALTLGPAAISDYQKSLPAFCALLLRAYASK